MDDALIPSACYPQTWYAATCDENQPREPVSGQHRTEVCVVGAGLAGLSVALELCRAGVSVIVVEAGRIAWGASGRNGGFVSAGFAVDIENIVQRCGIEQAKRLYQYSALGTQLVRNNIDQLAPHCLMGEGHFSVSRYPATAAMTKQARILNNQFDYSVDLWSDNDLKTIIQSQRYFNGIYSRYSFHIHPLNYALALAKEIENLGGLIFETSRARTLEPSEFGHLVKTESGSIQAEKIIICTSGYDQGFYPPVSNSVVPVATHVVVTTPLDGDLPGLINTPAAISDTSNACDYYRLIDDQRLLWGGKITTRKTPPKALDNLMHQSMVNVFPELSRVKIDYRWSGLMGYCRHKMPVIRQLQTGVWVATAFGGQGLNTTAMAGLLVSSAIVENDQRWLDFAEYDLSWNGGWLGQWAVQASYWWMQTKDRVAENRGARSRNL